MRLLVVTPTLPVPTSGGRTRVFNLVRELGQRHSVSVLSFVQPSEREMVSELTPHCEHLELIPFDGFPSLGRWRNRIRGWRQILFSRRPRYVETFPLANMRPSLRKLVREHEFDVAVFESLQTAELSPEVGGLPSVLVEQNVESDIAKCHYAIACNPIHKLRDWLTWRKLARYEPEWVRRFPVCVAVSEADAVRLREMAPGTDVHVVPNGVDVGHFTPGEVERAPDTLLFFGTLNYRPNADGLLWFCREIWPKIKRALPQVKLDVVGLDPPPVVLELEKLPGVQITGFVPDIRSKLCSATATVVPLRLGGGTRLKILEALAAGCPVVSTTVGAEGLAVVDGEHLLIADTAEAFARSTLKVLESINLRRRLAADGQRVVAERYDWGPIAERLEAACMAAINRHEGT